jgi:hypothetical protein
MNRAERWIGLTDGGNGLEAFVRRSFPLVEVVILDFWHVSDHLGELARALHPLDEEKAKAQKAQWCHLAKHAGGAALACFAHRASSCLASTFTDVIGRRKGGFGFSKLG